MERVRFASFGVKHEESFRITKGSGNWNCRSKACFKDDVKSFQVPILLQLPSLARHR